MTAHRPTTIHHVAICPADFETSLRFYHEGMAMPVIWDAMVSTDLITLLQAPSSSARSVFLGDPADPNAGVVELLEIEGFDASAEPPATGRLARGLQVLSFQMPVEETLVRLADLGLGGTPRITRTSRAKHLVAVVADPDGTMVEILDRPVESSLFAE
jgi:catechol 2,3-dioxygenase-like lactoylglutathione lyase family enzyme